MPWYLKTRFYIPLYCTFILLFLSRSFRTENFFQTTNRLFESLSEYLSGFSCHQQVNNFAASNNKVDASVEKSDKAYKNTSSRERASTVKGLQLKSKVELVSMLTDLSGLVREKSSFTQYLNYCYTINRHSRLVYLDILPTDARESSSQDENAII